MSLKVMVFSDDASIRSQVRAALGTSVARELPGLEFLEVATEPVVMRTLDAGGVDLVILDGEAHPAGGLGICRQIKDEIFKAPPVIVLIGRPVHTHGDSESGDLRRSSSSRHHLTHTPLHEFHRDGFVPHERPEQLRPASHLRQR